MFVWIYSKHTQCAFLIILIEIIIWALENRQYKLSWVHSLQTHSFYCCASKMADEKSIKLFQFNRNFCQAFGLRVPRTKTERYKIKAIQVLFVIALVQFAMTTAAFFIFSATTMGEFSITVCSTLFLIIITTTKTQKILPDIYFENSSTHLSVYLKRLSPIWYSFGKWTNL